MNVNAWLAPEFTLTVPDGEIDPPASAEAVIVKALNVNVRLVADVTPAPPTRSSFAPAWLTLRSLKVASPVASVVRTSVPVRAPLPERRDIVSLRPIAGVLFPNASCSWTVTAGTMTAPA